MSDLHKDKKADDVGNEHLSEKIHSDTMYFVSGIVREFRLYPEIIDAMRKGEASVELRKRVLLRSVDETWVQVIEDSLPALDEVIRKPSYFIEEREEVLPIELTKSVSDRSIKHLAQHTDYISRVEGDNVIPSKLLNVFHDETNQTYENKFVNTLINRLYVFVNLRYNSAKESGQDVKNTSVDFSNEFSQGDVKGKVQLHVELEQPTDENDVVEKNYIFTSDLWRRVERLNKICAEYMSSNFVRDMGKSFIRPPVMHTNALMKNKSLRQCLSLWEFIESYENTGLCTVVDDKLLDLDESYIRELYSTMAMEYLLFRHRVENGFDEENPLAQSTVDEPLKPEIVEDLLPATAAEFALHIKAIDETVAERTAEESQILRALEVALLADEVFARREQAEEVRDVYDRSFLARMVLAQEPAQTFYTEIKNYLLSFVGVKSRISWKHESYTYRNKPCARLTVRGKTLCVFLPLDPTDEKYRKFNLIDKSKFATHKNTAFCVKVRSRRTVKYVLGFIDEVMQNLGAVRNESAVSTDYRYPFQPFEELLKKQLIRLKNNRREQEESGNTFDSKAFMARLVLAQEPTQTYYSSLKSRLLSFEGVKSRVSWKFDSFNRGRTLCARIAIRGKTLTLFLNTKLSAEQAAHYHTMDFSGRRMYEKTPVALKVKSDRALKYALKLIELTMNNLDIAPSSVEVKKDFRIRLLERAELISKKWLKPGKGLFRRGAEEESSGEESVSEETTSPEESLSQGSTASVEEISSEEFPTQSESGNNDFSSESEENLSAEKLPQDEELPENAPEEVAGDLSEGLAESDGRSVAATESPEVSATPQQDEKNPPTEQISAYGVAKDDSDDGLDIAELIDSPAESVETENVDPTEAEEEFERQKKQSFLKRIFGSKDKRD